jgi:hypothetical protein
MRIYECIQNIYKFEGGDDTLHEGGKQIWIRLHVYGRWGKKIGK